MDSISSAFNSSLLSPVESLHSSSSLLGNLNFTSSSTSSLDILNGTFLDDDVYSTSVPAITPESTLILKKVHDILIVVLLVCVMFAMGCSITWGEVWSHIQKPVGVVIGMLSQFILLPLAAFGLIHGLSLDPLHATGMLILSCSPGGVTSNVFTYFCEGDLSLSVTMTSFSTVVALLMMPFNVWLYGRTLETESLVIPYSRMSISLLMLTTPVALGMLLNWKFPKIAPYLTKIGSFSGFGIIVLCQTMEIYIFPDIFSGVPLKLYFAVILLPIVGLTLGFLAGTIYPLPYAARRTIAIESGVQNVGTALTIVSLSFPFEQLRKVWVFPFLYAFSMLAICIIFATLFQAYKRIFMASCASVDFVTCEANFNSPSEKKNIPKSVSFGSNNNCKKIIKCTKQNAGKIDYKIGSAGYV